jgi:hypothetical protein
MKCRFCGCTENDACPEGCSWAEPNLCSVCALFKKGLAEYYENARRSPSKALLGRILDEIRTPFMRLRQKAGGRK